MASFELTCIVHTHASAASLPDAEQALVLAARKALDSAYAPYSQFQVGAALLLENGAVVSGSNQENAAYPSGLCAERVAFFSAGSQHPNIPILSVAITTSYPLAQPVSPCGACRQVMAEYELKQDQPIRVILVAHDGSIMVLDRVRDLLPMYFSGEWLRDRK